MRISLEQALDILMDHVTQGRTERKPLESMSGAGTFAGCICVT